MNVQFLEKRKAKLNKYFDDVININDKQLNSLIYKFFITNMI